MLLPGQQFRYVVEGMCDCQDFSSLLKYLGLRLFKCWESVDEMVNLRKVLYDGLASCSPLCTQCMKFKVPPFLKGVYQPNTGLILWSSKPKTVNRRRLFI